MVFTNLQVALSELPTIEGIEFEDLDRSYAWLVCFAALLVETPIAVAVTMLWWFQDIPQQAREQLTYVLGIVLTFMALFPLYRFKATRVIQYAVREHDLILKSGLFWQSEVIQPIRRIQHVELTRGPVEKRMGLANVRLFSAGSGKATFTIPGLRLMTAARTRRYVLQAERR